MGTFYLSFFLSNIVRGDEIFRDCDRHSAETVTLSKYVTEYEQMWKWMVKVLS